jgi:alcohol dehydrogenase class IV
VANAIILTRVMEFNRMACPGRFADIAAAMGVDVDGLEDMEAAAFAVEAVEDLGRDVGIPETLTEAGVEPDDIPALAEDAMKTPLIGFNPRKTVKEDVIALYEACM